MSPFTRRARSSGFVRPLLLGLVVVVAAIAAALYLARFSDGPFGIIAGGPLRSGTLHAGPEPDWSFVAEVPEVELALVEPPRSRTTWILAVNGRAYIPCGYMDSTWGKLWKQWPIEAERDGRAVLRIDGTCYERSLVRVRDPAVVDAVVAELARKYVPGVTRAAVDSGALWLFELAPRALASTPDVAFASFEEDRKGMLKTGLLADIGRSITR